LELLDAAAVLLFVAIVVETLYEVNLRRLGFADDWVLTAARYKSVLVAVAVVTVIVIVIVIVVAIAIVVGWLLAAYVQCTSYLLRLAGRQEGWLLEFLEASSLRPTLLVGTSEADLSIDDDRQVSKQESACSALI
jgi:hypothetical protein